jgi:polyhydroxyalkanoate synthesis regulator phasin
MFHSFDPCGGGEVASAREQYLQAMASFTEMTKSRAERLAGMLAKQGELQSGQVGRFAEDLVRRTQRNRETMSRLVQREVKRQLSMLGIATRDEVSRLQQRVRALEQAVERPSSASSGRAPGRSAATRSTTSRTAASKGTTPKSGASGRATRRTSPKAGQDKSQGE